jgi:nucleoside-diphosphate kinase
MSLEKVENKKRKLNEEGVCDEEEKCLVFLKPDAIERRLMGKIIDRIEQKGLGILDIKNCFAREDKIIEHYDHLKDCDFFNDIVKSLKDLRIVLMIVIGKDCVKIMRSMIGSTNPNDALPGTIRGDFAHYGSCDPSIYNLIHASDSPTNALREISIWCDKK